MPVKAVKPSVCPIARSLERVGEWWSILILRDAFRGTTRFQDFEKSLGIAPNMLTRRLNGLVESGLLEKVRYSEHPPRYEYRLTALGRDFRPVLLTLMAWGNRNFASEGIALQLADVRTGVAADPILVDRASLRPLEPLDFRMVAGPAADTQILKRYQTLETLHE